MSQNRENALIALQGRIPKSVPCYFSSCKNFIVSAFGDLPPFGSPGFDGFGVHQTPTASAGGMFTPTTSVPPVLTDITKWKQQVKFPNYDNVDWEKEAVNDLSKLDRENQVLDLFSVKGIFERLHFLMGFEEALCAIMDEPEEVYELLGAIADVKIKAIEIAGKYYKPDVLTYQDDYAFKDGLLVSPKIFREIFKPHLKNIFDAINKNGMIPKFHCCGKMEELAEDFIEIGAKALDPCQPCNNIPEMKKRIGKTCIVGGLDVQFVIDRENVTEEEIRAEVRRCIDDYAVDGRYIIYGASLSLYNPKAYEKDGPLGIIVDECNKYGEVISGYVKS